MPKTHITSQGEAWDQIAKKRLGYESMAHHLMAANPNHRHVVIFPADVALTVPDIDPQSQEEPPPWKIR